MKSVRKALGLLILGVVLAFATAGGALAQSVTPVPPADQGTYHVNFPEHDLDRGN